MKHRFAEKMRTLSPRAGAFLAGLCLAALLSACGAAGQTQPTPTAAPTPTPPSTTAAPAPEDTGRELTAEELERVNAAFSEVIVDESGEIRLNPANGFFRSFYGRSEYLDLSEFLRYFPGEYELVSGTDEAEFAALRTLENWPFSDMRMDNMPVPVHRIPASAVEETLRAFAGIGLAELKGVGGEFVFYLPEYDAYYTFTSDFGPGSFSCVSGAVAGDEAVLLSADASLTLRRSGEDWLIAAYQPVGEQTAVLARADLTGDGDVEIVEAEITTPDGSVVTLRVRDVDGTVLWERSAATAHVGWTELFLCSDPSGDYLLSYDPWMGQGNATYAYSLFTLEGGAVKEYAAGSVNYDINGDAPLPVEEMLSFAGDVNALIEKSTLLFACGYTDDGGCAYGPADAAPFLEGYQWLEVYGEGLYAAGDTLGDRLQKYSDWAVSHRAAG